MTRMQQLSLRFRVFFLTAFVAIPLFSALIWFNLEMLLDPRFSLFCATVGINPGLVRGPVTFGMELLGFLAFMLPGSLQMAAMWSLARLFGEFSRGELFNQVTVGLLARTGWMLLAAQVAGVVAGSLTTLVLTMHNPAGQHMITFSLSGAEIMGGCLGLALVFASRVLDEARLLREADALTI